jgi:hypothetical protein
MSTGAFCANYNIDWQQLNFFCIIAETEEIIEFD